MDDFGAAVSSFLSQPGAMDQMKEMAEKLGLGPSQGEREELPEGISPEMMTRLMGALSEVSKPDQDTAFLEALRPLLRTENRGKIDRAIKALRLMRAAKTVSSAVEL